jgi:hypothetical protein
MDHGESLKFNKYFICINLLRPSYVYYDRSKGRLEYLQNTAHASYSEFFFFNSGLS